MNSETKTENFEKMRSKLSWLWVFLMFNYIYADILSLMDATVLKELLTGTVGGMEMTQGLLLGAAVIMEIPILMVVLSRVLNYKANRWANIIAGSIKTLLVFASTFVGTPAMYYMFFGIIEMIFSVAIVWIAWNWKNPEESVEK